MATDPNTSTRGTEGRGKTEERSETPDRERNVELRREGGGSTASPSRRSSLVRRAPYYGTESPFQLMQRVADDIERVFSDFGFGRVGVGLPSARHGSGLFDPWRMESRLADVAWAPQVETFRREGNLVVRADLPGLTRDDIRIEVEDDVLMISGERSDETRDERDDFYRTERTYGRFFRAVQLPGGVDSDKIDATFKDGVLEVTIPAPKVTSSKGRQIKVR